MTALLEVKDLTMRFGGVTASDNVNVILGAALVFRLELRSPQPLDVGLILLAWLRRPAIEMPMRAHESRSNRLRRRLDEVYPF